MVRIATYFAYPQGSPSQNVAALGAIHVELKTR